jgi:proteasome lid subunit RPN8/RPN11
MNQDPQGSLVTWSVPQCPFTVECSARVLDEIRLTVIDAFFSLPRGGAEIGGLLLGRYTNGKLSVSGYRPLECEHAFGPSFTLSEHDLARLQEMLTEQAKPGQPQTVGWYHSHTRSAIFLSAADCEIHDRFFDQPWQVALVLKPHTFDPTRAGFFFRESDGHLQAQQSYREILLQPQPLEPAPPPSRAVAPAPAAAPPPPPPPREAPAAHLPPPPIAIPAPAALAPRDPIPPPRYHSGCRRRSPGRGRPGRRPASRRPAGRRLRRIPRRIRTHPRR